MDRLLTLELKNVNSSTWSLELGAGSTLMACFNNAELSYLGTHGVPNTSEFISVDCSGDRERGSG